MEGFTAQEAAGVMGITLFAVKSRLKRAKGILQIELSEEGAHEELYTERPAENV